MKKVLVLIFVALFGCVQAEISVTPTFVPRSQGRDKLRSLVGTFGWGHTDLCDMNCWYGTASSLFAYTHSRDSRDIATCMFGDDILCDDCDPCGGTILVQGSDISDRNERAWLADNLYLHCEYDGKFQINPTIENVLVDLDLYLGLDPIARGLYMRIYAPITRTKWKLKFTASNDPSVTATSCREGLFTPNGTEAMLTTLEQYFDGQAPATAQNIIFNPLKFAKIPACDESKAGFAEVRFELGWNAVQTDCAHFGFNLACAAPTGNKRRADYAFSPVVGNGNHWEAGAGITAHYMIFGQEDEEWHTGFYTDFNITHIFKANEERTFDLCGKPNSRYMLAIKMRPPVADNLTGSDLPDLSASVSSNVVSPSAQFKNEYMPIANLTTADISVKSSVQIDWVTFFNFSNGGFTFDLGYNFWLRTCELFGCEQERITACADAGVVSLFDPEQKDTWALKGDAQMFGFGTANDGEVSRNQPVALSVTQSNATIRSGTNAGTETVPPATRNLGADNARFAYAGSTNQRLVDAIDVLNNEDFHIKTSINPVFLNSSAILLQATRGLSHKVFAHIGYTWDKEDVAPFLGVGCSIEFGHNDRDKLGGCGQGIATVASPCFDCSLSQWAVWLKVGASFG